MTTFDPCTAEGGGASPIRLGPSGLPVIAAWDVAIGYPYGIEPLPPLPAGSEPDPARALRDALRPALLRSENWASTDDEFLPAVPQAGEIDQQTPWSEHEGPMEVQLVTRGTQESRPLVEPAVEAWSWFRRTADETAGHQDVHGSFDVLRPDENVEILNDRRL